MSGTNSKQDLTKYFCNVIVRPMAEQPVDWSMEMKMGIKETRLLYNAIDGYLRIWPKDTRPSEEYEYLQSMKNRLFAVIMDYNVHSQFGDLDKD